VFILVPGVMTFQEKREVILLALMKRDELVGTEVSLGRGNLGGGQLFGCHRRS
jgi:hypothetical protein